jgi:hypothetical protein
MKKRISFTLTPAVFAAGKHLWQGALKMPGAMK